jgi:branched-chain amino acid transport system ATP-binding protein
MSGNATILEAANIDAGYGGVPVVRGFQATVSPGQILAILGPNGAGKTTTLMTLAGVLAPVRGHVAFAGLPAGVPLHVRSRRGMRLLTEQRAVAMNLSTLENLRLGGGQPEEALSLFPELKGRLKVRAADLSGGEQQMVALGRSLSCGAKLLLADELSLGLAPKVVDRLLAVLRHAANNGLAVVLVEQMVKKALEVADDVVVMVRGRVRLSCPSADLSGSLDKVASMYFDGGSDSAA